MKYLILFILSATLSFGAITERYVNSAGSGAADGTSEANAMSYATFKDYMETGGSFTAAAGDRFNLKAVTYSIAASDTWLNGGSSTSPVIVRGYSSTITDGYLGRTNDNGDLIVTNMPVIAYSGTARLTMTGAFIILENVSLSCSTSNYTVTTGSDCAFINCKIVNSSTNAAAGGLTLSNTRATAINCDVILDGASGGAYAIFASATNSRIIAARVKTTSATSVGVGLSSSSSLIHSTIYGCGGVGVAMTSTAGAPLIYGNTIVGCGGDGIDVVTGTTVLQAIINNMITDNAGNGIDMVAASNAGVIAYNRFRDNGASINSGTDWVTATSYGNVDSGTTGTTDTDYSNYAGNDFRILSTSPATSVALPLKSSIGANQRDQTSAGGGGETSHTFVQ